MPYCHVTSTVPGRENQQLPRQLGFAGAPRVAFLDAEGRLLLEVPAGSYRVARFAQVAADVRRLIELRAKSAKGEARAALLVFELEQRLLAPKDARARRAQLGDESASEKARLDELFLILRIQEQVQAAGSDREKRRALGKVLLAELRAGTRPTLEVTRGYWFVICEHAEAARDVDGYALGLEGLKAQLDATADGAIWATRLIEEREQVLARLRR